MKFVYTFINSFLRTLARILCYAVIGGLLGYIVVKMGFKLPLFALDVHADTEVSVNGVNLYAKGDYYRSVGAGNVTLYFTDNVLYSDIVAVPENYLVTFCVSNNADYSSYYYNGNLPVDGGRGDFSFHLSNYPCKIKESHTQGRILYMFGKNSVASSVQGRNASIDNKWVLYQYGVVNWSLYSVYFVNEPITIDYANDAVISTNKDIINQNNTIINNQGAIKGGLDDINSALTDESGPNTDALKNSSGWLPAGPLDSLINLPLSLLNNLTTNMSKSCQPVNLPLPFLDKNLQLPCVNTLYSQIEGLSVWINSVSVIAAAFILFHYLMGLYKWVDDTLSFRENNYIDNWTGV